MFWTRLYDQGARWDFFSWPVQGNRRNMSSFLQQPPWEKQPELTNACFHNTRLPAVKSSAPWEPGSRQGAPSSPSLLTQCSHCLISDVRVLFLKLGIFFSLTGLSSLWEQRLPLQDSTPLVYSAVAMYWLLNRHSARSELMGCGATCTVDCVVCRLITLMKGHGQALRWLAKATWPPTGKN